MQESNSRQAAIRLGTHGEDYGNWMPVSMLRLVGGLLILAASAGRAVVYRVPSHSAWRDIPNRRSHIPCTALLDHMDPAAVCLRWGRYDGTGASHHPFSFRLRRKGYAAGCRLWLRRAGHPGRPDVAVGKSNGHRLLGRSLWIRPGYVREKRCQ